LSLARQAQAPLTVLSVATQQRVDVGCARCRQSAVIWNREMGLLARESLAEAAALVGRSTNIDYEVARGRPRDALTEVAARTGADLIVVDLEPDAR